MNYKNQLRGYINRNNGESFEDLIERSCAYYLSIGAAVIEKTPEPMKVIKSLGEGRFIACFEKAAQPDYKGTLKNGISIVFEAKHTDDDEIKQSKVTEEQFKQLEKYYQMGSVAFVIVSIKFQYFFAVPWPTWRDMKQLYKHKYMSLDELKPYKVPFEMGYVKFLK